MRTAIAVLCFLLASSASAELRVSFVEGAPKDRFVIENASPCPLRDATLRIDLEGSAAGLIFDTTEAGAGVEVFQPFELVEGTESLSDVPRVKDGDRAVALAVSALAPGARIVFTIDVDDTAGAREITVTDAEIEGASVSVGPAKAAFGSDARATMPLPCR